MRGRNTVLIGVVLALLLGGGHALGLEAGTFVYEGKLEDASRKPVGGVFPLTFSLHQNAKGGKSLWTESHFVAVDSGRYVATLGEKRPIPPNVDIAHVYLAVSITGGDEIVRERLDPSARTEAPSAATGGRGGDATGPGGRKVVDYAETAGLAYEAEHAKAADRIGTLSAADIEDRLKQGGGRASVGTKTRLTARAGGDGGVAYEVKCPKGYVVTGMRGGSGLYLDSAQLICSPLE
ncbi:MAG: hypothetical protein H6744_10750 [Deltaproteobacteria bacterium]|nr:hypothetical protein [Deltaproteobacteria bacterium]MCB9787157.1 hypothetical protein [Deltaproteobacteria bacterium]